ncbi:EcsC family protein [Paenibacillus psychroresistens]|uniref:EcsC family protein n=1 Tax=Paenibacillus psychroresistens TaxID=1778678 RepID=A0A6B8RSK1_9BACL|nr:EcsC family protein [Paenibacillus psychroresistens]QGQ98887.1 EcsC family protein [Paenibacillus psychroresistens]
MSYENIIKQQIINWIPVFLKPPGFFEKTSKKISTKINTWIPQKVHNAITAAVKAIVRTTLFGAEYTPKGKVQLGLTLEESDKKAHETLSLYQKIATAEGAGTGAGGILLNIVDFPALIAIKLKLLFELAHVYGYNTNEFSERIFILTVFQMAFTNPDQREQLLHTIQNWDEHKVKWISDKDYYQSFDWETFQKEYRDSIDFRKLLQMIPGIGAVAGALANYSIVEDLGEVSLHCYQIRRLAELA